MDFFVSVFIVRGFRHCEIPATAVINEFLELGSIFCFSATFSHCTSFNFMQLLQDEADYGWDPLETEYFGLENMIKHIVGKERNLGKKWKIRRKEKFLIISQPFFYLIKNYRITTTAKSIPVPVCTCISSIKAGVFLDPDCGAPGGLKLTWRSSWAHRYQCSNSGEPSRLFLVLSEK